MNEKYVKRLNDWVDSWTETDFLMIVASSAFRASAFRADHDFWRLEA